jgi:glutamine amidotransferase
MIRATVFDYGAGNLHSLVKALAHGGADVRVESDPIAATDTDLLVLPGVGAFGLAAERLAPGRDAMRSAIAGGLPTLGICLGLQLLFDRSEEGAGEGLGVLEGEVTKLRAARVPQIGWNSVEGSNDPLFESAPLTMAYYANSFVARPADEGSVIAWSTHEGDRFAAAVRAGSAIGLQFHPEKSSADGLALVAAVVQEAVR